MSASLVPLFCGDWDTGSVSLGLVVQPHTPYRSEQVKNNNETNSKEGPDESLGLNRTHTTNDDLQSTKILDSTLSYPQTSFECYLSVFLQATAYTHIHTV